MDRRSLVPPTTPQKRTGGGLQDLLSQFGSQSSATSVTKARKQAGGLVPKRESSCRSQDDDEDKRELDQSATSHFGSPGSPGSPTIPDRSAAHQDPSHHTANTSRARKTTPKSESSEDELLRSPPKPTAATMPATRRRTAPAQELKMELRRRDRDDGPRRSSRRVKNNILESDTIITDTSDQTARGGRVRVLRMKPDTARTRLRDDIARQSKDRASNFLVANRAYFLPLLPHNNHISKLAAKRGPSPPIIEYEELTEQPKGVTATMKPYQLSGLSFLLHLHNNGFSGILGDEMGLGKTLQTLSLFQYLEEQDRKAGLSTEELRPYLVVCPLSVLNSWVNEAQKWVPELKILRMHGTVNERNRLKRVATGMEDMYGNETSHSKNRKAARKAGMGANNSEDLGSESYKIIVTTYEVFQAEQSWFKQAFVWRYAVLDEGHKIKNSVTQISAALKGISAEFRLILTGTPLQNNLVEMWALLAWLYPDVFTASTENLFKESFDLTKGKVNRKTMDDARRLLELIMLRRMKNSAGVNLGLPEKEEVLLYVPLTPMQRFWYTRLLTRVGDGILDELFTNVQSKEKEMLQKDKNEDELLGKIEQLEKQAGDRPHAWTETEAIIKQALEQEQSETSTNKGAWQKLMNLIMQLRKCCSHPYLLPGAIPEPYYLGNHIIRASGKFILLEKLLRDTIFNKGKKTLIFSGFTRTLDCCEDLLTLISEHGKKFKHLRLDGGTARARRNLDIRMFNNAESDYKVMLLSTRAGGLGINLTSAEDVIFLDEDWNPQITLQAEARAHRIGQTKKVTIYKLCTQGTVEEQMMGRIRKKLYLSAKITESMRSIHGKTPSASSKSKDKARASTRATDDMPQMDTTQLKSLVRRGAQTLSHPEIDATEMLSWDLETMLQKCRDKPLDPQSDPSASASEVDEEKWLSAMERVECAVFDGKRYQRDLDTNGRSNILPAEITREDRRKGKNTTVMVDGFAISKESLNCADWEAVPTMAGKDPRLADVKREKRPEINHEEHCIVCWEDAKPASKKYEPDPVGKDQKLVECKGCPRAYHFSCLEPHFQTKVRGWSGFFCPQHECVDCGKKTSDAGGLIYRCRFCKDGYCEDCLDWGNEELIGSNLPEFEMLGEPASTQAFFIKCPNCVEYGATDETGRAWMETTIQNYKDQYDEFSAEQDVQQKKFEADLEAQLEVGKNKESAVKVGTEKDVDADAGNPRLAVPPSSLFTLHNGRFLPSWATEDDDADVNSPPALTDTSAPTPSGLSTPKLAAGVNGPTPHAMLLDVDNFNTNANANGNGKKRAVVAKGRGVSAKKAKMSFETEVDENMWDVDDNPLAKTW
ncbi:SNF2 family N-terminal domain-domain-containing protein [Clohesyomyces aquaticus]|uniref:SNF2 family N-terminal domain-domain-containing protein n=1 Tax=Clohesyomyces aquaticus TaxID=1231657 RepID=A0A1Y2A7B0_9PLEO|nr:SNF2 family N-terminal domain-domain-containing protein [Clohesyomyces aquaticus]